MSIKTTPTTPEELFNRLVQMNVNDHTELKNNLTYLSWAWAWQELKRICPTATYEIYKFHDENGLLRPYMDCGNDMGFLCFTSITALGQTHEMWLPVMDGANRAMKKEPYTYMVGKGDKAYEKSVDAATAFDINKTLMRCLVKNIAMFGLGLYIYAGEDLPIELGEPCTQKQIDRMKELDVKFSGVQSKFKVDSFEELTFQQAEFIIVSKEAALNKNKTRENDVRSKSTTPDKSMADELVESQELYYAGEERI